MDYPGKELELFDKASFWRNYLYLFIKKYLGIKILEVGAGIGSFTKIYFDEKKNITLTEVDTFNYKSLKENFEKKNNVKIENKLIKDLNENYDTILYLSVLEHIEKDKEEIIGAIDKLEQKGHLIICVPAHDYMFSNFDKEIGHFRRYEIDFFENLNLKNSRILKNFFIDSFGQLLYFLNKIMFSKEIYPSKMKIQIWDKLFVPITYLADFITFYKFGKNIICVIQKK